MELTTSNSSGVRNPTTEWIRESLLSFNIARDQEGFAILSRDSMTYVQVSGDQTTGFTLEYQEGRVEDHFRAVKDDFTVEQVTQIFSAYRDGSIDWSQWGPFERLIF